jgi:hypothetical protein
LTNQYLFGLIGSPGLRGNATKGDAGGANDAILDVKCGGNRYSCEGIGGAVTYL